MPGPALPATVVVPDLPAVAPYAPSAIMWVAVAVALAGLAAVVVIAVAAPSLVRQRVRPMRALLVAGAVMLVGIAAAALVDSAARREHAAARDDRRVAEKAARDTAARDIEDLYGVDLPDSPLLPVSSDAIGGPDEVVLPDGRRLECSYGTLGGIYELRCGGDDWDSEERLTPLGGTE